MKNMSVSNLMPGMKIAKDVYNKERLYLLKGFSLKENYIEKLKTLSIDKVWIEDENGAVVTTSSPKELYSEAFNNIKNVIDCVRDGKSLDTVVVKDAVTDIADHLMNNEMIFAHLTSIRDVDDYTYTHSINVCIFSVMIGKAMGFSQDELVSLGVCGLLHDVGKCRVPTDILLKPDRLTLEEFTVAKKHTEFGREIIKICSNLNERVAVVAFQHHERSNGSGYPLKIKAQEIDIFSSIVAVSDVYDAMTSDKVYSKKILPQFATQFLIGNSGLLFDPEVVKVFVKNVPMYPIGSNVKLSNGKFGVVVEINKNMLIRPIVKIHMNEDGTKMNECILIDMRKDLKMSIVELMNQEI